MKLNDNSLKPIYVQLAEWVEEEIIKGNLKDGDKVASQMEFARIFGINPMTAGKGVSILEAKGIVEKRRGLGMFITQNSRDSILEYRKNEELMSLVKDLTDEAKVLGLNYEQLAKIIEKEMQRKDD